jgi:hypothetical protein
VPRLAAPLLLVAALQAPFQCGSRVPPEHRVEDDAAETLYKLSEKFKTQGNAGAQAETLRFLVERYPSSRFAEAAKIDLEQLGPAKR